MDKMPIKNNFTANIKFMPIKYCLTHAQAHACCSCLLFKLLYEKKLIAINFLTIYNHFNVVIM